MRPFLRVTWAMPEDFLGDLSRSPRGKRIDPAIGLAINVLLLLSPIE
jgi:hypothetical protein